MGHSDWPERMPLVFLPSISSFHLKLGRRKRSCIRSGRETPEVWLYVMDHRRQVTNTAYATTRRLSQCRHRLLRGWGMGNGHENGNGNFCGGRLTPGNSVCSSGSRHHLALWPHRHPPEVISLDRDRGNYYEKLKSPRSCVPKTHRFVPNHIHDCLDTAAAPAGEAGT